MRVVSHTLKLSGVCDVVEFRADPDGVPLQGREGLWLPLPVEYKHGTAKQNDADRLQLCAQAIALEEMLVCTVSRGALYYAADRRREMVEFTPELREATCHTADRKSTRLNSSHVSISYAVFCLKKKKEKQENG